MATTPVVEKTVPTVEPVTATTVALGETLQVKAENQGTTKEKIDAEVDSCPEYARATNGEMVDPLTGVAYGGASRQVVKSLWILAAIKEGQLEAMSRDGEPLTK